MQVYKTETGSIYEVDTEKKLVRRIEGTKPPTERQGEDGVWKSYERLYIYENGLLFTWKTKDGVAKSTLTSKLV